MKKVCLLAGMLLLLSPLYGCKKKGKKDTKDKGDPAAMTAMDDMAGDMKPVDMKPAADSGLVKVDGVKPEHEKIYCATDYVCEVTVVTEKVKKELESKKGYPKQLTVGFTAKTTDEFFKTVANIPWVQELFLKNTQVNDLGPITKLKKLKKLTLSLHKGTDLKPLTGLRSLKSLSIRFPKPAVKDLSFVRDLKTLNDLSLTGFKELKDISALATLSRLKVLEMYRCNVTDIKALAGVKSLEIVRLRGNPIADISALAELSNVEQIDIQETKVKDLGPLKKLKNLSTLKVSKTISKKQIKRLKKALGKKLSVLVD